MKGTQEREMVLRNLELRELNETELEQVNGGEILTALAVSGIAAAITFFFKVTLGMVVPNDFEKFYSIVSDIKFKIAIDAALTRYGYGWAVAIFEVLPAKTQRSFWRQVHKEILK